MRLDEKQWIFAKYFANLIEWINSQEEYRCTIGEVERPQILQDIYYKKKKSSKLVSYHTYNLAGDLRIFKKQTDGSWKYLDKTPDYEFAGKYWESLDPKCVWGGRFGDNPATQQVEGWDGNHFQYSTLKGD